MNADEMRSEIRAKVIELAARLGNDASGVSDDEVLPFTGLLDSAGLMELVAWYEARFRVGLKQEDITIDNLGSIDTMIAFAQGR